MPEPSRWVPVEHYLSINGRDCEITLEPRPTYCDRGNWLAKMFASGELARDLDNQDNWPRYYMNMERAKLEIEDWLKKRGQWIEKATSLTSEPA